MHLEELIRIIKTRRYVLNITQQDLADLSGVGLRTLKALESGKSNPTLDTLNKLSEILGLELDLKIKKPKL